MEGKEGNRKTGRNKGERKREKTERDALKREGKQVAR